MRPSLLLSCWLLATSLSPVVSSRAPSSSVQPGGGGAGGGRHRGVDFSLGSHRNSTRRRASVGSQATNVSRKEGHRKSPISLSIRGGAFDTNQLRSSISTMFQKHIQPALQEAQASKFLEPVRQFIDQQTGNAQERRETYQDDTCTNLSTTTAESAILLIQPARILKLSGVAFVLAELLTLSDLVDAPSIVTTAWRTRGKPIWDQVAAPITSWWKIARSKGGLLQASTWTEPAALQNAWHSHVAPKYQLMTGLAVGLIFSPVVWTISASMIELGIGAYLASEVLYELKRHVPKNKWQNERRVGIGNLNHDIIARVDEALEGWRSVVRKAILYPKSVWSELRDRVDQQNGGGNFPKYMQRGVLIGVAVGVLAGA